MKKFIISLFMFVFSLQTALAAAPQLLSASKLYEQKVDTVFYIETQSSSGSGIILRPDGTFVTCFHVIMDADYIKVKTKNGEEYKVNGYKYLNPQDDIAILTVSANKTFTPAILSSKPVTIGESVFAISNPKGIQFVLSNGMINQFSKDYIQFSAPASPGSSGGALFNQTGDVIGMIVSQYDPSRTQNINFSIPAAKFSQYIDKKAVLNTKKLDWLEFIAQKAAKKDLEEYINFAKKHNAMNVLSKMLNYTMNPLETSSEDYAFWGALLLKSYLVDYGSNGKLLNDVEKWLALSVLSNKHTEMSLYGLTLSSVFKGDVDGVLYNCEYLKKYHKSYNIFKYNMNKFYDCDKNDSKCAEDAFNGLYNYLGHLFAVSYGYEKE